MSTINYYYTKSVLERASNDPKLFKKKLKSEVVNLFPYEVQLLKLWLFNFVSDKPDLKLCLIEMKEFIEKKEIT